MSDQNESTQINNKPIDYVISAARGILRAVPFAGSLLAELAGTVIPNQRIDRIARFAEVLENKLVNLEQEFVRSQLENEHFSDLLEESLRQASRSLSNERREYIANLVTNSLSQQDIEYVESKHLMQMLGELNDIEVIWLKFHDVLMLGNVDEFWSKHSAILEPISATMKDPLSIVDKEMIQHSYLEHLARLGLLRQKYKIDPKTKTREYDHFTGAPVANGYEITSFGMALLRQIGLSIFEK